jgi:hypothetical protein
MQLVGLLCLVWRLTPYPGDLNRNAARKAAESNILVCKMILKSFQYTDSSACSGVKTICTASGELPSPRAANATFLCFRMVRTKPLTVRSEECGADADLCSKALIEWTRSDVCDANWRWTENCLAVNRGFKVEPVQERCHARIAGHPTGPQEGEAEMQMMLFQGFLLWLLQE